MVSVSGGQPVSVAHGPPVVAPVAQGPSVVPVAHGPPPVAGHESPVSLPRAQSVELPDVPPEVGAADVELAEVPSPRSPVLAAAPLEPVDPGGGPAV